MLVSRLPDVQDRLDALARRHRVPGAALGVLDGDEVQTWATGIANVNTGVEATPDTLFQIGSNTKLYTTTLLAQLVESGDVDWDAPVRRYVREFRLADAEAAKAITVRMLVTHTSGIEGDHFLDTGRGDEALARYVASLAELGVVHPPGEQFSYCNAGFCLAGRIIEKVTGRPYSEALRERLLSPIGAHRTTVLAEEMLAHRYAVGHIVAPGKPPVVPPMVLMATAHAAAGSLTSATPEDVLAFVRLHLSRGWAPDGTRVLSEDTVRAMQTPQHPIPSAYLGPSEIGLGWMLSTWSGERVIGHGGGTIGQLSFLQVLPERPFGVVLLTNATTGALLWADLGRWLFAELAGVEMARPPTPADPAPDLDLEVYTGTFERLGVRIEVEADDGALRVTSTPTGEMAKLQPQAQTIRLRPVDESRFHVAGPMGDGAAVFTDRDRRGRPRYLHIGGRISRRVRRS